MYLIFALIDSFAFSPIARAKYSNYFASIGEANRKNSFSDPAKAVVALLAPAVGQIFRNHTSFIHESELRLCKRDTVFLTVTSILLLVPIEPGLRH